MSDMNMIVIPKTVGTALCVIAGMYGIGDERKRRLEAEGYNYNTVQSCVNELIPIIKKYD